MEWNRAQRSLAFFGSFGVFFVILSVILMLQDFDTRFHIVGVALNFIGWILIVVSFSVFLTNFTYKR